MWRPPSFGGLGSGSGFEFGISAPAAGSRFGTGTTIEFVGSATDVEDGMLTGSSLVWSSSRDGAFGSGVAVIARY